MDRDMRGIVQAGYERGNYGKHFHTNPDPTPFERRLLDLLGEYLPVEADVLDLGSGTGIPYDRYLVAQGYHLTGVDFSAKHLALARQHVPQATYLHGDFTRLAFPPESWDGIVSFYAIFHLPRQEHPALFASMYQWLKPRGSILLTLGAREAEYEVEADWLGAPMAWSCYEPETYKRLLAEAGFELRVCDFEGAPGDQEYHFWVLAQKG